MTGLALAADRAAGGVKFARPGHHHGQITCTTHRPEVTTPDIELVLPARAENIAVVRHAFGAFGDALALDAQTLADIRLAVTEACTNVVVHAYPNRAIEGPLQVEASIDGTFLHVVVRDEGDGITPRADSPGLGLGLPLIASLAESVELRRNAAERTEVAMSFLLEGVGTSATGANGAEGPPA
jgi:serine/threonine-protein kinase RsbW